VSLRHSENWVDGQFSSQMTPVSSCIRTYVTVYIIVCRFLIPRIPIIISRLVVVLSSSSSSSFCVHVITEARLQMHQLALFPKKRARKPPVAVKTVWSHCYTRAVSERFRDKGLIIQRYINSSVYFNLPNLTGRHNHKQSGWVVTRSKKNKTGNQNFYISWNRKEQVA